MGSEYAIEMLNITKSFNGFYANKDITLRLKKGEILALCGENGAGKSTLMSILFGLYQPDSGIIKKDGEEVKILDPNDATNLHIGMVHQHFKLVGKYSVLENIMLGNEPYLQFKGEKLNFVKRLLNSLNKNIFHILDYEFAADKVRDIIAKYGLEVSLGKKIEDISVETQQKTEIIKMLYRDNDILIFDEPTAVLTEQEIQDFLQIVQNLKKEGKSIIFISHKLNEIMQICDRVTIIRKGEYIDTLDIKNTTKEEIAALMVGRKIENTKEKSPAVIGEEILRVNNLTMINPETKKKIVNNVSFNVRKGEIVCLAGIDGNGQQELIYGVTGIMPICDGHIYVRNYEITPFSIRARNNMGISHIPEDRHKYGLVLDYSIEQNSVLENYYKQPYSRFGFINFKKINEFSKDLIEKYDIRSSNGEKTTTRTMSGGNQQKIIIGREVDRDTDLLIAVQPTRGLDIGAVKSIQNIILEQREKQKAVLLVSLELDQVFELSDRILVMYEGEIVGEFKPNEVSKETLGLYMSGGKRDTVNAIKEEQNE